MKTALLVLLVVLTLAAGISALVRPVRRAWVRWRLRRAPSTPIELFEDEALKKVVGHLRFAGEPLIAPLSGRECAHYEVTVQEYHETSESGDWTIVIEEQESRDFLLDDGTGTALVRCSGARLALDRDTRYSSELSGDAGARFEAFLASHSEKGTGLLGFERTLRYREARLEEGECVAVYGVGRWRDVFDDSGEVPRRRLVFDGADDVPLYVSDHRSTLS